MPAPDYVPVRAADQVRPDEILPVPDEWLPNRPADITTVAQPKGDRMGNAGPDQGYALKLAKHFTDKLQITTGEHSTDAVMGCLGVALKRAALFGRAPVIYDLELAYTLFGYLGDAPADLLEYRKEVFAEVGHHYEEVRGIADSVPESTLRMSPADVGAKIADWKELITYSGT